ncbi:type I-C CRISPR-associated protein Cas8c/Csd1 [Youngiibacter fragilis]|uniref:CRISPR-associated protein Csd1 n=1 Tax=Youngiibacter fragilis 232.1 TaxID=994573 RepID=V7I4J1_9CLOT|nr:type I-C CRISPR-associated protein Cas8c/Csd1 [Youngiibacter fragilis]ETA80089.1 CRISPR-associated protein Csd1 [Youngiibacter fragilis 232.1]
MILLALKEYYDRKICDGSIAKDGWINGSIDFLIDLDEDGNATDISDLRELDGKRYISKRLDVPNIGKQALKHSNSGKDANFLWDNASFVLGLGEKGDSRLESMLAVIEEFSPDTTDIGVRSVKTFLEKGLRDRTHFHNILNHSEFGELFASGSPKLSFRVPATGFRTVFDSPEVSEALVNVGQQSGTGESHIGTCLITGKQNCIIEATHSVTKGVWGAQTSGACVVSFNKDSFNSYNKIQSYNAPIGKTAASQYTKALNTLLESKKQTMHIGDTTAVFWSERKSMFEDSFSLFFNEPDKDDPEKGTEKIKELLSSFQTGTYSVDNGDDRFYILGLSPNAARVSIRFWHVGTIAEYSDRIRQYFEDFKIIKPASEPEYYSIWRILVNTAVQDKSENIPPNVAGDLVKSILEGTPYPETLLQAVLRRIRSDKDNRVKPVRAAIIKAYLNRYYKFHTNTNYKEVSLSLDENQKSTGYQLGRLFAILEKIQEEANPGTNTTIRERFYGSACSSPVTVFPNLMRLKNHHLAKMDSKGKVVYFEQLLGNVIENLSDFPSHLPLHQQGLFAVGYYHQRQDFFTKKSEKKESQEGK